MYHVIKLNSGDATLDFFEVIDKRRSIRKFSQEKVPESVIERALDAAILAPNSSNAQTWDFYWVKSPEMKKKFVSICLDQSAARTASDLVAFVASPKKWKRSQPLLSQWVTEIKAPKQVVQYYKSLIPFMYRWGFFNLLGFFKFIVFNFTGLFRPLMRGPAFKRDVQEVAIKSTALASENFVLAISAQGYSSCMMEGFDEWRAKSALGLGFSDRVVMVVAVGRETESGTWGPQFRIPKEMVIHRI